MYLSNGSRYRLEIPLAPTFKILSTLYTPLEREQSSQVIAGETDYIKP